ncbi:MAG: porin [Pirellulales bacterium]|nr:porin [Pirellulales bacterium]
MAVRRWILGFLLVGTLAVSSVFGQTIRQPAPFRQVSYQEDPYYYLAQKEPAAKSPSDAVPEAAVTGGECCTSECGACDELIDCHRRCCRRCSSLTFGGWLQVGMTGNGMDPHDRYNGPNMTNDRVGDLQMNQLWFYAQRPVNTGGDGFDIGGRVDVLYGTDWRIADCHGRGLEDRMNGPNTLYGLAIPQFYAEFGINNLSIKMGRMAGILGYESVVPMMDFFYSHNYQICYMEPVLITGLMTEYKFADQLKFYAGFHNGVHNFENENGDLNGQAGVTWTSCDGGTSLAYAFDLGRNDALAQHEEYIHSIVFKKQLTHRLQYVLQSDYSHREGLPGQQDTEAYGIAQYLFYKIDNEWTAGMRVEWFRDDDGTKVFGVGNLPDARGWDGAPGYAGNFTDVSMGLNWKPRKNITLRPEVRWDWYDGPANQAGPDRHPYDDGHRNTQFTFATDLVITF